MKRNVKIDILSILFGIGTWVCVNGLWVELPLLVQKLPEGWTLPSFMAVVIQLANIGPLSYTILNSFYPGRITEKRSIYFTNFIGFASLFLLIFFWDKTTFLVNSTRSTAFLSLVFFLAMVDCSSRVLYLPFMAKFQDIYLMSFFIGEGLSGLVPSIFALLQGVGGNPECRNVSVSNNNVTEFEIQMFSPDPTFSIETFFILLLVTTVASCTAFYFLNVDSLTKGDLATNSSTSTATGDLLIDSDKPVVFYNSTERIDRVEFEMKNNNNENDKFLVHLSVSAFVALLGIQVVACGLSNGAFPSIQSYSCLPYGNVAYHWTVVLANMANPAVCFLSFVLPEPTLTSICSVGSVAVSISVYVMFTALSSPTPPLVGQLSGEILLVLSWVLLVGLFTYVKISVASILRSEGKRGLFWCGALTQIGSAIGAIILFFLVNFSNTFQSYNPCE